MFFHVLMSIALNTLNNKSILNAGCSVAMCSHVCVGKILPSVFVFIPSIPIVTAYVALYLIIFFNDQSLDRFSC